MQTINVNSDSINNLREVEGEYVFREGETFDTYEELLERLDIHSKVNLVYYWRRDSRTIERAFMKTSRQIASKLKYYVVHFACIYGGMKNRVVHGKNSGKRATTQHTRTNCPAHIQLRASKCGQKLEVISVCNLHNHEISEKLSQTLPQNRKLSIPLKEEVIELLRLKIDRKKIIEYVKQRENKLITSKDLFNLFSRLLKRPKDDKKPSDNLAEIKKRSQILQKINSFVQDKSLQSIINSEIAACETESQLILYPIIDTNHLVEYISPDHEFVVNETIIDSIVEARKREIDKILSSNAIKNENNSKNTTNITDMTEKASITDSSIFLNFDDVIMQDDEDEGEREKLREILGNGNEGDNENIIDNSSIIIDETNLVEEIARSNDLMSKSSRECSSFYNEFINQVDEEGHEENYENIIIEENTTESTENLLVKKLQQEIIGENFEICKETEDGGVPSNQIQSNLRVKVQSNRKRIIKCRKCGTNAKLLQMQINYLKAKKDKLLEETNVLRAKKLKLKVELRNLNRTKHMMYDLDSSN